MKPCNITSRLLIIAQISESNKITARFKVCNISYMHVLFHSCLNILFWYINHGKIKGKECIHVTIHVPWQHHEALRWKITLNQLQNPGKPLI
jgi:hypothetical protein